MLTIEQGRPGESCRGFPEAYEGYSGGSRGPEGVARLRCCAVVRESLLYNSELIEGVARLYGCTVVRENLLCYSELIVM